MKDIIRSVVVGVCVFGLFYTIQQAQAFSPPPAPAISMACDDGNCLNRTPVWNGVFWACGTANAPGEPAGNDACDNIGWYCWSTSCVYDTAWAGCQCHGAI